jgi:hypothetical protein
LQLLILYDKVPGMKLRPVSKLNQTCRASLTRIVNAASSSICIEKNSFLGPTIFNGRMAARLHLLAHLLPVFTGFFYRIFTRAQRVN